MIETNNNLLGNPVSFVGYAPDEITLRQPAPTITDDDMEIIEENIRWYRKYCLGIKE